MKTFDDLMHEADVAVLAKEIGAEEPPKIIIYSPVALPQMVPDADAPARNIKLGFGSNVAMTGDQLSARRAIIEARGDFESKRTVEEDLKEALAVSNIMEDTMWETITEIVNKQPELSIVIEKEQLVEVTA